MKIKNEKKKMLERLTDNGHV